MKSSAPLLDSERSEECPNVLILQDFLFLLSIFRVVEMFLYSRMTGT